jgi:carboxyl-terminal processing protease
LIAQLKKGHDQRLKTEQGLIDYQYDVNELNMARLKKTISLNYETRKTEQDERKEKRDARIKIGDSLKDIEMSKQANHSLDDLKDPLLKETIILLAEQVAAKKS